MSPVRLLLAHICILSAPLLALSAAPAPGRCTANQDLGRQTRMTHLTAVVRIVDGVATTTLRQTLRNDGSQPTEAVWLLPLPEGAVADEFRMRVGGVSIASDVLAADEARGVYEGIVRRSRDPGLLEYTGRGCLRARVFLIPPEKDVLVEVTFRQVLPERAGQRRWSFPLAASGVGGLAPEDVVLDLSIESRRTIQNAFAPISGIEVLQKGDHEVRASCSSWATR